MGQGLCILPSLLVFVLELGPDGLDAAAHLKGALVVRDAIDVPNALGNVVGNTRGELDRRCLLGGGS